MPTTYAIPDGRVAMAATLWTGDGANPRTITNTVNGVSLQPDLVWVKARSNAYDHTLYDSIRGATNYLISNSTATEGSAANTLQAFNSNGFQVGGSNSTNSGSVTYVGWQWKAGGAAVTNTAGSITSQVSANTAAGFSVVTWAGNTTSGATVGHGLGVKPDMIIFKRRNGATDWHVYHSALSNSANALLYLNTIGTPGVTSAFLNGTQPTSSIITLGDSAGTNGSSMVAYCFAAVPGYSAFGSYTGNGSTDGPFVYLGFRPRFVMYKRTDTSGSWVLLDSTRGAYNVINPYLLAESSGAEDSSVAILDFLSNGFKQRNTYSASNASGGTYIYMAFAETAFKYANAR
jgi:hypothetical protein